MSEWWTYRPSDFLMFSARSYYRLFELHNTGLWPAPLFAVGVGLCVCLALWRSRAWAPRIGCCTSSLGYVVFGMAWVWVGWAFHAQRFAAINSAATVYAAAFAVQGLILILIGGAALGSAAALRAPLQPARAVGLGLLIVALLLQPALAPLFGRPWQQAEVWAMAPDPTVLGTLGLLLAAPRPPGAWHWLVWPIPLLWCAVTGLTLATMGAAEAVLLPAAGLVAATTAWRPSRTRAR